MKKHLKALLSGVVALALCAVMAGCGSDSEKSDETFDPNISSGAEGSNDTPVSSDGEESEEVFDQYVPSGAKVSNDLPLSKVVFNESITIDFAEELTLADLCALADEATGKEGRLKVTGEGVTERDYPELYLCTQSFSMGGDHFDIETTIDGVVVNDRSSYYADGTKYANPDTSYADMKIKVISNERGRVLKESVAFCEGAFGQGTPRSEVEDFLGEGKLFKFKRGTDYEQDLYVYENDTVAIAFWYYQDTATVQYNKVRGIYLFLKD